MGWRVGAPAGRPAGRRRPRRPPRPAPASGRRPRPTPSTPTRSARALVAAEVARRAHGWRRPRCRARRPRPGGDRIERRGHRLEGPGVPAGVVLDHLDRRAAPLRLAPLAAPPRSPPRGPPSTRPRPGWPAPRSPAAAGSGSAASTDQSGQWTTRVRVPTWSRHPASRSGATARRSARALDGGDGAAGSASAIWPSGPGSHSSAGRGPDGTAPARHPHLDPPGPQPAVAHARAPPSRTRRRRRCRSGCAGPHLGAAAGLDQHRAPVAGAGHQPALDGGRDALGRLRPARPRPRRAGQPRCRPTRGDRVGDQQRALERHPQLGCGQQPQVGQAHHRAPRPRRRGGAGERQRQAGGRAAAGDHGAAPRQPALGDQAGEGARARAAPARRPALSGRTRSPSWRRAARSGAGTATVPSIEHLFDTGKRPVQPRRTVPGPPRRSRPAILGPHRAMACTAGRRPIERYDHAAPEVAGGRPPGRPVLWAVGQGCLGPTEPAPSTRRGERRPTRTPAWNDRDRNGRVGASGASRPSRSPARKSLSEPRVAAAPVITSFGRRDRSRIQIGSIPARAKALPRSRELC